ncbi:MAG: hypothetical protein R2851_23080 [Caldilineaceae bacterium]
MGKPDVQEQLVAAGSNGQDCGPRQHGRQVAGLEQIAAALVDARFGLLGDGERHALLEPEIRTLILINVMTMATKPATNVISFSSPIQRKRRWKPRGHKDEVDQPEKKTNVPPMSSMRLRLRAWTMRLSRNISTKNARVERAQPFGDGHRQHGQREALRMLSSPMKGSASGRRHRSHGLGGQRVTGSCGTVLHPQRYPLRTVVQCGRPRHNSPRLGNHRSIL